MDFLSKVFGRTTIKIKAEDQFWERDQYQPTSNIYQRRESMKYGNSSHPQETMANSKNFSSTSNLNGKIFQVEPSSTQPNSFVSNSNTQEKNSLKTISSSNFFQKRAEMVKRNQSNDTREEMGIPLINSVSEYSNSYTYSKPINSLIKPKVLTRVSSEQNLTRLRKMEKTQDEPKKLTFQEMEASIRKRVLTNDTPSTSITSKRIPIFENVGNQLKVQKPIKIQSNSNVSQNQNQNTIMARPQIFAKTITAVEKSDKQSSLIENNLIIKPKPKIQSQNPNQLKDLETLIDEDRKLTSELISLEVKYMNFQKDPRNLTFPESTFASMLGNHSDEIQKFKTLEKNCKLILKEIDDKKNALLDLQNNQYFIPNYGTENDIKEKEKAILEIEKLKIKIRNQKNYIENFDELTAEKSQKFRENSEKVIRQKIEMAFMDIRNSEELLLKELKQYDEKMN